LKPETADDIIFLHQFRRRAEEAATRAGEGQED
jgi:hypothetical protein